LARAQIQVGEWELICNKDGQKALTLFDQSMQILEDVQKRDSTLSPARISFDTARQCRAEALTLLGRHSEAIAEWDRVLDLKTGILRPWTRAQRSLAIAKSGDYVLAAADIQKLLDEPSTLSPGVKHIYATAAKVFAVAATTAEKDQSLSASRRAEFGEHYAATAIKLVTMSIRGGTSVTDLVWQAGEFDRLRTRDEFLAALQVIPNDQSSDRAGEPAKLLPP
jgi:tetratricopeptide (TPR) repeat protein